MKRAVGGEWTCRRCGYVGFWHGLHDCEGAAAEEPARSVGRPALDPSDSKGTMVTTIRLTAKQRATFDMLGGPSWVRHEIDRIIEGNAPLSNVKKARGADK